MKKRLVLLILSLLILVFFFTRPALILEDREGDVLSILPLFWEGRFTTVYVHSVEKTPVLEFFQVKGYSILLEKTFFSSYGAGLPLEEKGFNHVDDLFVVQDIEKTFSQIYFRVSMTPDQYLLVRERKILFHQILSPGQRLTIRGGPLYYATWHYLLTNFLDRIE